MCVEFNDKVYEVKREELAMLGDASGGKSTEGVNLE